MRCSVLLVSFALTCWTLPVGAAEADRPPRIERLTLLTSSRELYFLQSRAARIPGNPARMLVTTQETERVGAHGFRDLFQAESTDDGRTWSTPERIESLRRRAMPEGYEFVIGDFWPQWHAATGVVLGTGKTFGFQGGTREDKTLERVSYSVFDPLTNAWSGLQLLTLPESDHHHRPILSPNSGCCQRYDLPTGEILLPIRYQDAERKYYITLVARCRFDGRTLEYVEHGSELTLARGRGLYEPSVTGFGGKFYLTMRADHSAFVARSDDGLNYEPMVEWTFDDGSELGSYNTQQHWLAHGDKLYLCYTRRGADNDHIFRHRAPLFLAQVDPERLCVLRATEQVVFPAETYCYGNFGVMEVSAEETWIVESQWPSAGFPQPPRNHVIAARIRW